MLGPWFLGRFLAAAGPGTAGASDSIGPANPVDYAIVLPPVEVCLQRVATRPGHGFDNPGATAKMHHEFAAATVDRRHVVDDRTTGPDELAAILEERVAAGSLRYRPGR